MTLAELIQSPPRVIVGAGLALIAVILSARLSARPLAQRWAQAASLLIAAVTAGAIILRLVEYGVVLRYGPLDPWNESIAAIAAAWLRGQPLYPLPSDGLYYGLLYGPLIYRILAAMQDLGGIGTWATAVPGILAEMAALFVTAYAIRRSAAGTAALRFAMAWMVGLVLLTYPSVGFRTDPFLLLLASLSLAAVTGPAGVRRTLALGLCAGLATALKPTGALYIGPALLAALPLHSPGAAFRFILWAGASGLAGALLPFIATGATPGDYLAYLAAVKPWAFYIRSFVSNLVVSTLLLFPTLLLPSAERRAHAAMILGLALCLLVASALGALEGAFVWHLTPLLPYAILLLARAVDARPGWSPRAVGQSLALLLVMATGAHHAVREMADILGSAPRDVALRRSIQDFMQAHPGAAIAISPADSRLNRQITWLTGQGVPLILTYNAWIDLGKPEAIQHFIDLYLTRCDGRYWLTKSKAPFAPDAHTPASVQAAFLALYRPRPLADRLQVWSCDGDTTGRQDAPQQPSPP